MNAACSTTGSRPEAFIKGHCETTVARKSEVMWW